MWGGGQPRQDLRAAPVGCGNERPAGGGGAAGGNRHAAAGPGWQPRRRARGVRCAFDWGRDVAPARALRGPPGGGQGAPCRARGGGGSAAAAAALFCGIVHVTHQMPHEAPHTSHDPCISGSHTPEARDTHDAYCEHPGWRNEHHRYGGSSPHTDAPRNSQTQHHSPALVRGHSTSGRHGFSGAGSGSAVGRGGDNDSGTGGGEGGGTGSGRGDVAGDGMVVTDATVDAVNLTATHRDRGPSRICPRIGLVAAALPPRKPGRTRRLHRSCAPIATSRTTSCE